MRKLSTIVMGMLILGLLGGCGSTTTEPTQSTAATVETTEPTTTETETSPSNGDLDGVVVDNINDFIAALGDNTTIYMKPGKYNFSQYFKENDVKNFYEETSYVKGFYKNYDDGAVLAGYRNLTIASLDPENKAELVIEDPYSHVIQFSQCTNLTAMDLYVGHDVEPGVCWGNVIHLDNCSSVNIKRCDLYGCGAYGISSNYTSTLTIMDCIIHDCSYGCMDLFYTSDVFISKTEFTRCKGSTMFCLNFSGLDMYNCSFRNLSSDMFYISDSNVILRDCNFDTAAARGTFINDYYGYSLNVY